MPIAKGCFLCYNIGEEKEVQANEKLSLEL